MNVRGLFKIVTVCLLLVLGPSVSPDPDLWWHLKSGEYLLAHGMPSTDVFSYTARDHAWVMHEWLSELVMWGLYSLGGFGLLNLAFAAVSALGFWLVYLRCPARAYLAHFVVVFAAFTATITTGARPQVFNILLLGAFVFFVEGFKERVASGEPAARAARLLWPLPALGVLWANLHSGFLVGIVLLATYVAGEAAQLRLGRRDARGLDWAGVRQLALFGALTALATLANPQGFRLWLYPFETMGFTVVRQGWVVEWRSPDFHDISSWPFALMLAAGLATFAFARRMPALTDLLLFLGTAWGGLQSVRHVALFAVVATPIVCRNLVYAIEGTRFYEEVRDDKPEAAPAGARPAIYWAAAAAMVVLAVADARETLGRFVASQVKAFPVAAVDFVEREGLSSGRVFNAYHWGGYLIWRGLPVHVDGRADVYGDEFMKRYTKAFFVREDWREPLDEYRVDYVLIEKGTPLAVLLAASGEWREAYRDELAVVFVRAG